MNSFFGMDNPIMNFLNTIFDLIILNLCFLFCCIPLITIGPSITALNAITLKIVKKEESYIFKSFFQAFLFHFKQATIFWILYIAFLFFIFMDFRIIFLSGMTYLDFLIVPIFLIALLGSCFFFYIFPVLAYWGGTWKQVIKSAAIVFFQHISSTFSMLIILIFIVYLSFLNNHTFSFALSIFTIIGFSAISLLYSLYFKRIFS